MKKTEAERLVEALERCDTLSAIKVTAKRREQWLTKAKPGDRWGVTVVEGGYYSFGRTFSEAFWRAMELGGATPETDK